MKSLLVVAIKLVEHILDLAVPKPKPKPGITPTNWREMGADPYPFNLERERQLDGERQAVND